MNIYERIWYIIVVAYIWLPGTSSHLWTAFHLTKRWPPLAMPGYSVRLHFAHQFTVLTSWAMQNFWDFGCKRSIMYWLLSDEPIWEIDPALNPSFQSEISLDVAQVPIVCHSLFTGVWNKWCLIIQLWAPVKANRQVLLSWLILSLVAYLRHPNLEPTQVSTILTKEWPSHLTGPQRRRKHQVPASTAVSWGGEMSIVILYQSMSIFGLNPL